MVGLLEALGKKSFGADNPLLYGSFTTKQSEQSGARREGIACVSIGLSLCSEKSAPELQFTPTYFVCFSATTRLNRGESSTLANVPQESRRKGFTQSLKEAESVCSFNSFYRADAYAKLLRLPNYSLNHSHVVISLFYLSWSNPSKRVNDC